ncbi:hypothetical protein [Streptomyces sp. NBC_00344]|uniref:hypothetical protein n=1 Tax=Streptomyces sp. NBC_00344 TaxID=2975720 RepID=UPI002E23FF27
MSPYITRAARLRPLAITALSVAAAVTLNACDAGGADGPTSSASRAPKGVITKAAAKKLLDRYESVNYRSNQARNEKLLSTVEAGQLNAQSTADYEQWKTRTKKDQKKYTSKWSYTNRSYYIPSAGTASWFAVKATATADTTYECLLLFDKVGGTYKVVDAVYAKKGLIPKLATDRNGLATAVDPAKRVGTLSPNQVGDALSDVLETGGKKEGTLLASTADTEAYRKWYTQRDTSTTGKDLSWRTLRYFTKDPAHPKVYSLRLANGGALGVFPYAFNAEYLDTRYTSGDRIIPSKEEAIYDSKDRPVVIDVYQGQAIAALTSTGKPRVLGDEERMVDSR